MQFGGQTPLRLAVPLERAGRADHRHVARRDRPRRGPRALRAGAGRRSTCSGPPNGIARSRRRRRCAVAERDRLPGAGAAVLRARRPRDGDRLRPRRASRRYMRVAVRASPEHPVLIDQFLEDAIEVDVDAVSDGDDVVIGGIMEHIERAGVHSGDSACSLPPYSIDAEVQAEIRRQTVALARELGVRRPDERAVRGEGPRRLRARGEPARVPHGAVRVARRSACRWRRSRRAAWSGGRSRELGFTREIVPAHVSVKEAVFPFIKFPGVDTVLGPEMKSTGEVMGIDATFGAAFAKAQIAAGTLLPTSGQRLRLGAAADRTTARRARSRGGWPRAGFRLLATRGHGGRTCAPRGSTVDDRQQGAGGQPAHRRRAAARRGRARHQHAVGRGVVPRLVPDPAHRARVPGAVLHDDRRGRGGGRGHRAHARAVR